MDRYEKSAEFIMKRGDKIIAEKKHRRAVIMRSAALTLGAAAIVGIGICANALKPPKKPTPSQSGIIIETETSLSETTATQASPSTTATQSTTAKQTTAANHMITTAVSTAATASSVQQTAATHITAITSSSTAKTVPVVTSTAGSEQLTTSQQTRSFYITTLNTVSTTCTTTNHPAVVTTIAAYPTASDRIYIFEPSTDMLLINSGTNADKDLIGPKLKNSRVIEGQTVYGEMLSVEFYELSGVSSEAAVAVRFESENRLPVYLNTKYEPETLGDMLDDMGLGKYMDFGSQNIRVPSEQEYYDVPGDRIMSVLEECRDAVNTQAQTTASRDLIIFSDIAYMRYNTSFFISKEGYITTNIIDRGASFYIGEDKAISYIKYLLGI